MIRKVCFRDCSRGISRFDGIRRERETLVRDRIEVSEVCTYLTRKVRVDTYDTFADISLEIFWFPYQVRQ